MQWLNKLPENASEGCLVVIKSTVPVGTADMVREIVQGSNVVDVVSNPEFLRGEGVAIETLRLQIALSLDFVHRLPNNRLNVCIQHLLNRVIQMYFMDNRSAEITKYAANSLLATKISFANELARLCEASGADIDSVRLGTGSDSRIGAEVFICRCWIWRLLLSQRCKGS